MMTTTEENVCRPAPPFGPATEHDYLSNGVCIRCGQRKPGSNRAAVRAGKVHLAGSIDHLPVCTQHDCSANTRDISKWICTSNRDEVTCKVCVPHARRRS